MLFKPDFAPSAFMTRHYEFGGEADQFDHMIFTLARIALAGAEFSAGHTLRILSPKLSNFKFPFSLQASSPSRLCFYATNRYLRKLYIGLRSLTCV